jgi:hypothetical protein
MEAPGRAGRALGSPPGIRGDGAAAFKHSVGFKTWSRKHKIAFNPVEPYRHTMQGYIENLVRQMTVHSRCILKHANLPARFWSETTTMYMAVRNIMPTDKLKVPLTAAPSHRLHFDPKLMLHRPGFSSDLKIDTLDNPTLARLLLSHQTPLEIKEGELVEPIGVRRNKNKTYLECRFIAPEQKTAKQILASVIEMSNAPKV